MLRASTSTVPGPVLHPWECTLQLHQHKAGYFCKMQCHRNQNRCERWRRRLAMFCHKCVTAHSQGWAPKKARVLQMLGFITQPPCIRVPAKAIKDLTRQQQPGCRILLQLYAANSVATELQQAAAEHALQKHIVGKPIQLQECVCQQGSEVLPS